MEYLYFKKFICYSTAKFNCKNKKLHIFYDAKTSKNIHINIIVFFYLKEHYVGFHAYILMHIFGYKNSP